MKEITTVGVEPYAAARLSKKLQRTAFTMAA